MKIHPFANLFPMQSNEEIQTLADDIAKHGLRQPIVIDRDEQILDGRNRWAACKIAQVTPIYEPFVGTEAELLAYVVSVNIHRRHLSPSQLAMVADKVRGIYDEEGKENQKRKPKDSVKANLPEQKTAGKQSRDKAAEAVGVSGKLADAAKKVRAKGTEELQQAVESGEVSVTAAALVADLPQEKQTEILSRDDVRQAAADLRAQKKRAAASSKPAKAKPAIQKSPKAAHTTYLYSIGECGYQFWVHSIYRQKVATRSGNLVTLSELKCGDTIREAGFLSTEVEKPFSNVSEIDWSDSSVEEYETDQRGSGRTRELDLSRFESREGGGQYLYFEPGRVCYYDRTAMNAILAEQARTHAKANK